MNTKELDINIVLGIIPKYNVSLRITMSYDNIIKQFNSVLVSLRVSMSYKGVRAETIDK